MALLTKMEATYQAAQTSGPYQARPSLWWNHFRYPKNGLLATPSFHVATRAMTSFGRAGGFLVGLDWTDVARIGFHTQLAARYNPLVGPDPSGSHYASSQL